MSSLLKKLELRIVAILLVCTALCLGCETPEAPGEPVKPELEPAPVKPAFAYTSECKQPTQTDLLADPVVQWGFKKALHQGVIDPKPIQNAGLVTEEGGWIRQCKGPKGHYLDVILVPSGSAVAVSLDDDKYYAGNSDCRTVGAFHTHPHAGKNVPSEPDKTNSARRGVPSFVVALSEGSGRGPYLEIPPYDIISFQDWNDAGEANLSWLCCPTSGLQYFMSAHASETCPSSAWQLIVNGPYYSGTYVGDIASYGIGGFTLIDSESSEVEIYIQPPPGQLNGDLLGGDSTSTIIFSDSRDVILFNGASGQIEQPDGTFIEGPQPATLEIIGIGQEDGLISGSVIGTYLACPNGFCDYHEVSIEFVADDIRSNF